MGNPVDLSHIPGPWQGEKDYSPRESYGAPAALAEQVEGLYGDNEVNRPVPYEPIIYEPFIQGIFNGEIFNCDKDFPKRNVYYIGELPQTSKPVTTRITFQYFPPLDQKKNYYLEINSEEKLENPEQRCISVFKHLQNCGLRYKIRHTVAVNLSIRLLDESRREIFAEERTITPAVNPEITIQLIPTGYKHCCTIL